MSIFKGEDDLLPGKMTVDVCLKKVVVRMSGLRWVMRSFTICMWRNYSWLTEDLKNSTNLWSEGHFFRQTSQTTTLLWLSKLCSTTADGTLDVILDNINWRNDIDEH